jgi:HEXXH motif-containing protein
VDLTFEPSAARGAALDRRMRERLADSLDYIFTQVGEDLGVERALAEQTSARIRSEPQSPHRFGAYYDLVLAIENEDLDEARRLARELTSRGPVRGLCIVSIGNRPEEDAERYRRLFLDDPLLAAEPDPALLANTKNRIESAFALLEGHFPGMAAEIRELLREIVIAAGPNDPNAITFDGASSYMLWGATLLNARGQKSVLDTAQALAHESGHNLLFGYCASGPLVENADEELFPSPLRKDLRPMDGIVHATYVVARMHQTLERLVSADVLSESQTQAALADLDAHVRNFEAGDAVIRQSGRLTALGAEVIDSARAHMAAMKDR